MCAKTPEPPRDIKLQPPATLDWTGDASSDSYHVVVMEKNSGKAVLKKIVKSTSYEVCGCFRSATPDYTALQPFLPGILCSEEKLRIFIF